MIQRLYYENAYIREFDAVVTGCMKEKDHFRIMLDRSAFYPEGGGQSGDRGFLIRQDGSRLDVSDTREDGGDVYVVCSESVPVGEQIHGVTDWIFRFDRMQNHSGEHIVSGLIHETYGYNNVGFHMSSDRMTIDLDGEISDEGLDEIERRANEIVWADSVIRTDVYSHEEAAEVEYRSKKELMGDVRVVTIPGADVCACCGTHVARTGEIGIIKLLSHERLRGGIRIEMMCGRWAYEYLALIFRQNHEVSACLSSRMHQTSEAAKRMAEENTRLKGDLIGMLYAAIDRKSEELEGAGDVAVFVAGQDSTAAQKLTAKVMETCGGIAFSFAGSDDDGYKYAVGQENGSLKELVADMNRSLDGRGGGRPYFQQGSVTAKREQIEAFLTGRFPEIKIDLL